MRISVTITLILAVGALAGGAWAQDHPDWVTADQMAFLRQAGVDPDADIRFRGPRHWTWYVKRRLSVGDYHCPVGSLIDISKTTMYVRAPEDSPCGGKGGFERFLTIHPNGQVEPLEKPPGD